MSKKKSIKKEIREIKTQINKKYYEIGKMVCDIVKTEECEMDFLFDKLINLKKQLIEQKKEVEKHEREKK